MNETPSREAIDSAPPEVDPAQIQRAMFELRSQQSLLGGTLAGIVASAAGAAAWAGVTIASGFQIGWMAVGIGFLVGFAVRAVGKGIDPIFGYIGAGLALIGCLAGNLAAMVGFEARQLGMPILDLVSKLSLDDYVQIMIATLSPIDLLFYGIAVYEGYRLSFRQLTEREADALFAE